MEVAYVEHHLRRRGLRGDAPAPVRAAGAASTAPDVERQPATRRTADAQATRDRLTEEVERKPRDHDGGARGRALPPGSRRWRRRRRRAAGPSRSWAAGRPRPRNDRPEKASSAAPAADGRVDDQRLGDVGQHVPGQVAEPADAGHAGGSHEVPARRRRTSVWVSRANAGSAGQPDGQHRTLGADSEDHREEQREQQPGNATAMLTDGGDDRPARRPTTSGACTEQQPGPHRRSRSPSAPARPTAGSPPGRGRRCRGRGRRCLPSAGRTGLARCCGVEGVGVAGPQHRARGRRPAPCTPSSAAAVRPSGVRTTASPTRWFVLAFISPPGSASAGPATPA